MFSEDIDVIQLFAICSKLIRVNESLGTPTNQIITANVTMFASGPGYPLINMRKTWAIRA